MRLRRANVVVCECRLELDELIKIVSSILRSGGVDKTVFIDPNGRAVENVDLCVALKRLGARYIPVSHGASKSIFVPLESLGFFEDINLSTYRVFRDAEELLYRNWPTPLVRLD
ncbi:MAG: hypothetical protein ACO2OS_06625 [Thermosphaera aggregans]